MAPLRGPVLLALLCLFFLTKSSFSSRCEPPNWNDSLGPNPVTSRRGNVVLVAMFHGYCHYCVQQAGRLYQLKNDLAQEGYPQIEMVIVNGGETRSRNNVNNLINASPIPVIQDRPDNVMYRRMFGAYKDDFIVYDRCGQLAFYIPHPYSNLNHNITGIVLKAVHNAAHTCYCSLDYSRNRNMDDTMMGDDPGVSNTNTNIHTTVIDENTNFLNCQPSNTMCQRFQRLLNRPGFPFGRNSRCRRSRRGGQRRFVDSLGCSRWRIGAVNNRLRDLARFGRRSSSLNAIRNRRFNRREGFRVGI